LVILPAGTVSRRFAYVATCADRRQRGLYLVSDERAGSL
jgi:hypothetical protein